MIANILTGFRILLMFPLFYVISRGPSWDDLALFLLAGFTDIADGYLARKLKQATAFGAMFDKLADRFLTISVSIAVIAFRPQPMWVVAACVILIARDALVACLNEFLPGKLGITVSWLEKIKITLVFVGFGFMMSPVIFATNGGFTSQDFGGACLALGALLCLSTLVDYSNRAWHAFREV